MLVAYKLLQVNVVTPLKTESDSVRVDFRIKAALQAKTEFEMPNLANMVEVMILTHSRVNGYQLERFPFKTVVSDASTLRVVRG